MQDSDPLWILSSLAALQLDARNLNSLELLEQGVARAACALAGASNPGLDNDTSIEALLRDADFVGEAEQHCDPFNNPVCAEITFHGGSFRVLPGNSPSGLRAVKDAIRVFAVNQDLPGSRTVTALLDLGDWVAHAAGWDRRTTHIENEPGTIATDIDLSIHKAVIFTRAELTDIVRAGINHLDPVTTLLSDVPEDPDLVRDFLVDAPLVQVNDDAFVLVLPHELLATILSVIARVTREHFPVAAAYREVVHSGVQEQLRMLFAMPQMSSTPEGILVCPIDNDKVALVAVVADDFSGFGSHITDPWTSTPQFLNAVRTLAAREKHFLAGGVDVHQVIVLAPLGRGYILINPIPRTAASGSKVTVLTAAELESLFILEAGDQLALWKFARATSGNEIGTPETGSQTFGDVFDAYRRHSHSFYFGDDERPDRVFLPPDGDGRLRREAQRHRDWHGVLHWDGLHLVEVTTKFDTPNVPIYFTMSKSVDIGLFVEMEHPVWVTADKEDIGKSRDLAGSLALTVAYWYWQLARIDGLKWSRANHDPLHISVAIESPEQRTEVDPAKTCGAIVTTAGDCDGGIKVHFHLGFVELMSRASNEADREVLRSMIPLLVDVPGDDVERLIDTVAPLGIKKLILGLTNNRSHHIEADPALLPKLRLKQEADTARAMDMLGEHLIEERGYTVGELGAEQGREALNDAVTYHLDRIQDILTTVSPDELLETLLEYQEAFVYEQARRQYHSPVWAACFGDVEDIGIRNATENGEFSQSAIAVRFIIEVAVACPASGERPLSMGTFDELVAHASEIITRGMTSDELFNCLGDHVVSILPSRRLGVLRDSGMAQAREAFSESHTEGQLADWTERFPAIWGPDDPEAKINEEAVEKWNTAVAAEIGVRLHTVLMGMELLVRIADKSPSSICVMTREEVIARLSSDTDIEIGRDDATAIVDFLTLEQRDHFVPDRASMFKPYDVFPWRFGRALSLLRRPLVARDRPDDSRDILWGKRNISAASRYLVDRLTGTRYEANTQVLREMISRERNRTSSAFDARVAKVFSDHGIPVEVRVKNLAGVTIERESGQEIGDFDVLAVDPVEKVIWACEAKNFLAAGTVYELAQEIGKLLGTEGAEGRHTERLEWLRNNPMLVAKHFEVEVDESWSIRGMIVTSAELLGARVRASSVPIRSIRWLRNELSHTERVSADSTSSSASR